jgi:hypothetical protein
MNLDNLNYVILLCEDLVQMKLPVLCNCHSV